MTHEDAGHYALKHKDREVDPEIRSQLEKVASDGKMSCSNAHKIATSLGKTPAEVGIQADLMELRLMGCSLGLFGHGPSRKNFNEEVVIQDELKQGLDKAAPEGWMTCLHSWEIAGELKMKRVDVASACERLGIKIKQCQLGAF